MILVVVTSTGILVSNISLTPFVFISKQVTCFSEKISPLKQCIWKLVPLGQMMMVDASTITQSQLMGEGEEREFETG